MYIAVQSFRTFFIFGANKRQEAIIPRPNDVQVQIRIFMESGSSRIRAKIAAAIRDKYMTGLQMYSIRLIRFVYPMICRIELARKIPQQLKKIIRNITSVIII